MRTSINPYARVKVGKHHPAADTAAVVTIAASAEEAWALEEIHFSYDKANGAAQKLSVSVGGTEVWAVDIPNNILSSGPHGFRMHGLGGAKNEAVVVTLATPGAGTVTGKLNVIYR